MWKSETSCGMEFLKCRWRLIPYLRGTGLDLGCGKYKVIPRAIGLDMASDGEHMHIQRDITDLSIFADNSLDYVFSSHALEDQEHYKDCLVEWWRVVRPGGYFVLYLPHKEYYPNAGTEDANPKHIHDFIPDDIIQVMKGIGGVTLLRNDNHNEDDEYAFELVFQKQEDALGTYQDNTVIESVYRDNKSVLIIRYGAFGDAITASSVFKKLKNDGYKITMCCSERGYEVLKHDPNIDAWWLQDTDQVPNELLDPYWIALEKTGWWNKVINLNSSAENLLLYDDKTHLARWSKKARSKLCDHNYYDVVAWLADYDKGTNGIYYATEEEKEAAKKFKKEHCGGSFTILWTLAGSSHHKIYPYMEHIWGEIFENGLDVKIVTVGDDLCRILEAPENPVLVPTAGKWSIRQSLSFMEQADMIIGPETGVMNAAGGLHIPKITMLSHSSPNNLTKYWKNNVNVTPKKCDCHPCHVLHFKDTCPKDAVNGAALCAAFTDGRTIYKHINVAYSEWNKGKIQVVPSNFDISALKVT